MQEIDKLTLNLSLNEIKKAILYLQDKIELYANNEKVIDINVFKGDILKEISYIRTELDKKPTVLLTEMDSLRNNLNNIQKTLADKVYPILLNQPSNIELNNSFNNVNMHILDINKKICEIETKSFVNSNIINNINKQLTTVSTHVNNLVVDRLTSSILISYPTSGTATITEGNTTFDFRKGKATYPDGTEYNMSGSSVLYDNIYIKSFTIFTDRPIDISMQGKTLYTTSIPSGSFRLKDIEISKIKVKATGDTNIWICGSTLSDAAPNISFSFGNSDSIGMPNTIIKGSKIDISTTATQITTTSTPINKVVVIKIRSLGTGTYIAVGDSSSQPFRLTAVKDSLDIDWIDNLNKVYILTDAGTTGSIEWIGG